MDGWSWGDHVNINCVSHSGTYASTTPWSSLTGAPDHERWIDL